MSGERVMFLLLRAIVPGREGAGGGHCTCTPVCRRPVSRARGSSHGRPVAGRGGAARGGGCVTRPETGPIRQRRGWTGQTGSRAAAAARSAADLGTRWPGSPLPRSTSPGYYWGGGPGNGSLWLSSRMPPPPRSSPSELGSSLGR